MSWGWGSSNFFTRDMAGTHNDDNIALYGWPVHSSPDSPQKTNMPSRFVACLLFFLADCPSSLVAAAASYHGSADGQTDLLRGQKRGHGSHRRRRWQKGEEGGQLASQSANTGGGGGGRGGPKAMKKGGEGKPLSRMQREEEEEAFSLLSLSCGEEEEEGIACICVWIGRPDS